MPEPRLTIPLQTAMAAIDERIVLGKALFAQPIKSAAYFEVRREEWQEWRIYNHDWLLQHVGRSVADEVGTGHLRPEFRLELEDGRFERYLLPGRIDRFRSGMKRDLLRLGSIWGRLQFWADEDAADGPSSVVPPGAVFVVHGHDLALAKEVTRMIEQSTGRSAVILREQPNQGRLVLEKFEDYAADAAFAVVLLTADDEGRERDLDPELHLRGRQNVIFELGFFYGRLGRERVTVLIHAGVEHPSDVAGLAYTELDASGDWRQELNRELAAAGLDPVAPDDPDGSEHA
jgi:hypothetical protein